MGAGITAYKLLIRLHYKNLLTMRSEWFSKFPRSKSIDFRAQEADIIIKQPI